MAERQRKVLAVVLVAALSAGCSWHVENSAAKGPYVLTELDVETDWRCFIRIRLVDGGYITGGYFAKGADCKRIAEGAIYVSAP